MRRLLILLVLALASAAAASAPAPEASPFGVVLALDPSQEAAPVMAALRGAGLSRVRIRPDWRRLQPTSGAPDWSWSDTLVRSARAQGLGVLFTLGYTPRWASKYADSAEEDVWARNPPKAMALYEDFVRKASARYSGDVVEWQVWEQTSLHHFRGSWKDLRDLSQATMRATRGTPRRVVLPESGNLNLSALDQCYRWGTDVYFDVLGLYPNFERPEAMLRPLAVLQTEIVGRKGPLKDLWISGIGWPVAQIPGPLRVAAVSEEDQARFLVRGMALALAHGVRRIYWDSWQDVTAGPYQEQSRSGLLRADGSPRPALGAYQHLARQLTGAKPEGLATWGPHAFGTLFRRADGSGVLVAWTDRDSITVALPGGLLVADLQGQPCELRITGSPVWVTGPFETVQAFAATPPDRPLAGEPDYSQVDEVRVDLGAHPREQGLHVGRYRQLESGAVRVREKGSDEGWSTEIGKGRTSILFDVDDSFLYFVDGRHRVEVEVEVWGNEAPATKMGFNVQYDSTRGFASAPWRWVDEGPGWKRYTFPLDDPDFSDPWSDFRLNVAASRQDVLVRSVVVRRAVLPAPTRGIPRASAR